MGRETQGKGRQTVTEGDYKNKFTDDLKLHIKRL